MGTFRFDCVFYYVRELDRAIAFYTTVLGFPLSSRDAVARFRVDGVLFELIPTDDPSLLTGRGNARLTLEVADVEATLQELRAKGVRTSGARKVSNGYVGSVYDPDGNEICVWQYS
jgi:catechol 2,3-dioxygenase-like lactoylglutathione lyase family enzyme